MKALLYGVVLLLTPPSVADAAPFVPDLFQLDILNVAFDNSGTNSFCSQCDDQNPTNDVLGTLLGLPPQRGLLNFVCCFGVFEIGLYGPATAFFVGLNEHAVVDVRLTLWDVIDPAIGLYDPNPDYPLPSVSYFQLSGDVIGFSDFIVLECCFGGIKGISVITEGIGPHYVDTLPGSTRQLVAVIRTGEPVEYTPVPEPATLLLFGTGLIGLEWRRSRRHQR